MKEGKHTRKDFKIIEAYSVLILIATLFMSIGYAVVSETYMSIRGEAETIVQTGVFITNVTSSNAVNSKVNYFIGTTLSSDIALQDGTVTYDITLYNNSDKNYFFIDVITGSEFSSENIEFSLNGLEKYVTPIAPNSSLNFSVTLNYVGGSSEETLTSILNFRFKEMPTLVLSNEEQIYTLNDIYPGYTSEEYEFTVSNYNETETNIVPMSYSFEIEIDTPLTAKIYDESGIEVTEPINIEGDGQNQVTHQYTLKIEWDESKNDSEYAGKDYKCSVSLKATPTDKNYLNYTMTKQFKFNIKSLAFDFKAEPDSTNIEFSNNKAEFNMAIEKNNDIYETTYKITLTGNDKFTLYINDEECVNNEITLQLVNENLAVALIPKTGIELDIEEQCNITVQTTEPYKETVSHTITITRDLEITPEYTDEMIPVKYADGQWVEADVSKTGDWFDYTYQKWANVRTDNGYFVYVPRFAYKITSGYHTALDTAGTIAIVFLNEDNTPKTTKDSEGNIVNQSDLVTADQVDSSVANTGINATTKYIIHPAFTAFDTAEKNIDGLWVAKYEMSMEATTDGGDTWNFTSVESTTVGNILTTTDTTKRMVSKPGVSSWRYIDVTNIFANCYNMNRNLDSHMMKNTEWGAATYLAMSKYGKGATSEVEQNKSSSYLTGYGANGTLSTGAASTTGNMYGIFDLSGGSYEYVAGYLNHTCLQSGGTLYSVNESLVVADKKYKDVYESDADGITDNVFSTNNLKVGDGLWELSDGSSIWFRNEFFYAGMLDGEHYPIFDRGGDYGSWSSSVGINYTGRNHGQNHLGVTFRAVIYVK